MRPIPWLTAEPHRIAGGIHGSPYGADYGAFLIPHPPTAITLRCIVSSGKCGIEDFGPDWAWDHVSVSLPKRCPNWPEMSFIRSVFFADDETVMQLHVPTKDHLSLHPYCLHLWRPLSIEIPRPPSMMVAAAGDVADNARVLASIADARR